MDSNFIYLILNAVVEIINPLFYLIKEIEVGQGKAIFAKFISKRSQVDVEIEFLLSKPQVLLLSAFY